MNEAQHGRMTKIELAALTAVVNATRVLRDATNSNAACPQFPCPYDDTTTWPELDALHTELRHRGVMDE